VAARGRGAEVRADAGRPVLRDHVLLQAPLMGRTRLS
jgi:hypothetical protein